MSLHDEINKGTQLPNKQMAQFVSIDLSLNSDDDSTSLKVANKINKSKNLDLYNPVSQDYVDQDDTNNFLDYNEITSSILETNGGDSHTNKAIEKHWKIQVKENQSQKQNDSNKNTILMQDSKKSPQNSYKNNPLMRNLLEKKMAELQVSNSVSSNLNGGKTTNENSLSTDDAMLIAELNDPEIFYLRNTSEKIKFLDDGFRFEHRGIKKTITPQKYLIHEIDDDDFIFKK